MHLRLAVPSDARDIARVHVESWRVAYRGLVPQTYLDKLSVESREAFWMQTISTEACEVWVAEVDSALVGWIALGASRDDDATFDVGELQAIYLLPEYWAHGIGRALWRVACGRLLERGFSSAVVWVFADNARAIRFYRAAGFTLNSELEDSGDYDGMELKYARYEIILV
ncbi:hypothetical protein BI364_06075 [Acidihalobacter yilgarnensis]|uniref:N-acetyltransferase domain-containing protein n=1 Tax=Acidihalobacter yilgarnensis TaxID=2819280 RepID=A0A1D8IM92_9GAMM|nr:hypothetical protein BI364_06075 [Acidihalobacter yilgarnensis]